MMSSTPSADEECLSQMTTSTRASFFSATGTTSSSPSPRQEQVDQTYLTPFEGTSLKLRSPFQVNPGARAAFWKYYHYYEGDST